MLNKLKYKLTHLQVNSWHHKLVEYAYWGKAKPHKACPYWWLLVPASPIAAGLKLIALAIFWTFVFVVGCILWLFGNLVYFAMWLFGRRPIKGWNEAIMKFGWMESHNDFEKIYEKNDNRFAPYQFVLPALAVGGLVTLWLTRWPWLPWLLLALVAGVATLYGLGKFYTKLAQPLFRRLCPPIVWEGEEAEPSTVSM